MIKNLIKLVLILALVSCSTINTTTTNVQDLRSYEDNSIIYALPRTVISTTVRAKKYTFTPGPFHRYAKELLGIEGVGTKQEVGWQIIGFKVDYSEEPDPDHYYSIKNLTDNILNNSLMNFEKYSFIFSHDFNYKRQLVESCDLKNVKSSSNGLVVTGKIKEVYDDTIQDIVPVWQTYIKESTKKEQAKTVADLIFKTRLKKFQVLTGKHSIYADGDALRIAVNELDELESEYLSLFIGTYSSDTITRTYFVRPESGEKLQRFTLFRFSEDEGIKSPSDNTDKGFSVIMEVKDLDHNVQLNQTEIPTMTGSNYLIHRICDKAFVKVFYGSHSVIETELPIFQLGALHPVYFPGKLSLFRTNR